MKREGRQDVLALEELYLELREKYLRIYDRITSGRDFAQLNQDMGNELGEGAIRRNIDYLKSYPDIGDKRSYITRTLDWLANLERRVVKYIHIRLDQLTQEDLEAVTRKYVELTGAVGFETPTVWEVRGNLSEKNVFERRQIIGELVDSKLKIYKKEDGILKFVLDPNEEIETEFGSRCRKEFSEFVAEYEIFRRVKV